MQIILQAELRLHWNQARRSAWASARAYVERSTRLPRNSNF